MRPVGGWLPTRSAARRVTFWTFIAMALGVLAVLHVPAGRRPGRPLRLRS